MKRVLRYSGLFVLIVIAGLCLTRAIVGLSFVMGDHVFLSAGRSVFKA